MLPGYVASCPPPLNYRGSTGRLWVCGLGVSISELQRPILMGTKGPNPSQYGETQNREILKALNSSVTGLYGEVVKAQPVGVGGRLQRSWTLTPATSSNPTASIGTNSQYFLSVEMGRVPGKGISKEGQESVALWARRKLTLSEPDSRSFAFLLSRKYRREGRPAQGLLGLAQPGSQGASIPKTLDQTVPGSLLREGLSNLEKSLSQIK